MNYLRIHEKDLYNNFLAQHAALLIESSAGIKARITRAIISICL
jgi:hypothetical protein